MEEIQLQSEIIYGPINSRRLGNSLGINFSPLAKVCSFDCVYCQYGKTKIKHFLPFDVCSLVQPEQISKDLVSRLKSGIKYDYITFSGNGETTLHPQFQEIVSIVKGLRDRLAPQSKLALLSNGSTLGSDNVLRALDLLDFPIIKLDAGDQETFQKINRPHSLISFEDLVFNLKKAKRIVLQSMFVAGEVENCSEDCLKSWLETVREINPQSVQIYSLDRPASKGLKAVPKEKLKQIAFKLTKTGIKAKVY